MEISFEGPYGAIESNIAAGDYEGAWRKVNELDDYEIKALFFERIFSLEIENLTKRSCKSLQVRVGHVNSDPLRSKLKLELIEASFKAGCLDVHWTKSCFVPASEEREIAMKFAECMELMREKESALATSYVQELEKKMLSAISDGEIELARTLLQVYVGRPGFNQFGKSHYFRFRIMLLEGKFAEARSILEGDAKEELDSYGASGMLEIYEHLANDDWQLAFDRALKLPQNLIAEFQLVVINRLIANMGDGAEKADAEALLAKLKEGAPDTTAVETV